MSDQFLFNSFWQAGFECSTHILKSGKRLDLVAATGHDRFADEDFARLKEMGIRTAREGLRWHLIETRPGHYDFTSAQRLLEASQRHGIQIIWDLLHFGWPEGLDIFAAGWVESFGDFAFAFARVMRKESDAAFVAPVNEISFFSWAGGDTAYLNPFATGRGGELKRQLVRAAIRASDALLAELPGVRLVSPEPVIHIAGDPARPERRTTGCGVSFGDVRGLGHVGRPRTAGVRRQRKLSRCHWHQLLRPQPMVEPRRNDLEKRTRIPAHFAKSWPKCTTVTSGLCSSPKQARRTMTRPDWLAYVADEARAAMRSGIPLHGICLYPILNHPGWNDNRHCCNGLWDYPGPAVNGNCSSRSRMNSSDSKIAKENYI